MKQRAVILPRKPARPPRPINSKPETVRMNFLTHGLTSLPFFLDVLAFDGNSDVLVAALLAIRSSHRGRTHPPPPFGRTGIYDSSVHDELVDVRRGIFLLRIGNGREQYLLNRLVARLLVNRRIARASCTFLPRIRSITSRAFCGDPLMYLPFAIASISISIAGCRDSEIPTIRNLAISNLESRNPFLCRRFHRCCLSPPPWLYVL